MTVEVGATAGAPTRIAGRIAELRARIDEVARSSGRSGSEIAICGVTKGQLREAVVSAIEAGLQHVGENYVQESRIKYDRLPPVTKHFIGHVQTNKAKRIVEFFDVVQSVDRIEAGRALARAARNLRKALHVLVQVNVSPYDRFGIAPEDAPALADALRGEGLVVDGVMAIGPLGAQRAGTDAAFALARRTFERVGGTTLSLGMSGDWERAVAHGSTMVRIGTALFGERPKKGAAA